MLHDFSRVLLRVATAKAERFYFEREKAALSHAVAFNVANLIMPVSRICPTSIVSDAEAYWASEQQARTTLTNAVTRSAV